MNGSSTSLFFHIFLNTHKEGNKIFSYDLDSVMFLSQYPPPIDLQKYFDKIQVIDHPYDHGSWVMTNVTVVFTVLCSTVFFHTEITAYFLFI